MGSTLQPEGNVPSELSAAGEAGAEARRSAFWTVTTCLWPAKQNVTCSIVPRVICGTCAVVLFCMHCKACYCADILLRASCTWRRPDQHHAWSGVLHLSHTHAKLAHVTSVLLSLVLHVSRTAAVLLVGSCVVRRAAGIPPEQLDARQRQEADRGLHQAMRANMHTWGRG